MNKTNKLDNIIFNFLKKYCFEVLFFIITIVSLKIRTNFIRLESGDYQNFLYTWFNQIKEGGGLLALKQEIGDYNIPYLFIIAILSYLPINPLISIKMVSIIFDYSMAIVAMLIIYEIFKDKKNKHIYALLTYSIVVILPTVVLNSSAWAQCDSIYTTFILLSLLFIIKEKYFKAFIFFGIAFSFKLQSIFILPVFIILYLANKKFSIYYFFIIPIVNIIMCLPAIMAGRSVISCFSIYFNQTGTYTDYISMNFPSIYAMLIKPIGGSNLIANVDKAFSSFGILFTLSIFVIIAIIVIYKDIKIDKKMVISLSLWSVMICTFLLPSMHDRYMYMADVISIIWFIINKKKIYIPIAINFISLYTYIEYLYATRNLQIQYVALLNFIVLFILSKELFFESINKVSVKAIQK